MLELVATTWPAKVMEAYDPEKFEFQIKQPDCLLKTLTDIDNLDKTLLPLIAYIREFTNENRRKSNITKKQHNKRKIRIQNPKT